MRIQFNQTIQGYNLGSHKHRASMLSNQNSLSEKSNVAEPVYPALNLANFPNISFRARNIDADFLLSQTKRLKCAYSGKYMLAQNEIKDIFQKLERRPNAQSAINLLQNYERYMHNTEAKIFEILKQVFVSFDVSILI